jgi:hypothetical protein
VPSHALRSAVSIGSGPRSITVGAKPPITLRLWTIQHQGAWEKACRRGVLRADGRFVFSGFRPAYRWMCRQMARRGVAGPNGYPVWAWCSPKPDLRRSAHLERGERGVRLEFFAPIECVLLSDFQSWHCILNDGPIALGETEYDAFRRSCRRTCALDRHAGACREAMEATWERVFELNGPVGFDPDWWGESNEVQAVLPEVPLSWITAVTPFLAR